ncbi:MAG: hypothetical protein ACODAJ_02630 [Planctomycetota bacterium]
MAEGTTLAAALAVALGLCGCGQPGQAAGDRLKVFILAGQSNMVGAGFAGWQQKVDRRLAIMQAQAAVAQRQEFEGNVVCVETRGLCRGYPSRHNYHWNNNGETYYLIGQAMGRAMVELLGGPKAPATPTKPSEKQ